MRASRTLILLSLALPLLSCGGGGDGPFQNVGGVCEYTDIPGTARIVDVRPADPDGNNCKDAVEVEFDFTPDDRTARDRYRFPGTPDTGRLFTVGAGMNPPAGWVAEKGLTAGSAHRAVRSEIETGTCTPVLFTFPGVDLEGWEEACF